MPGAQTAKEANGFGNEVVMDDLKWRDFGREKSQRLPRVQGGWVEGGSNIVQVRRERAGYSWKVRARL